MDKKKYKFSKKTAAKFVFVIIAVAVVYSLFTNISHRKIDNGEEVIAEGEAKLTLVNVQNGQAALVKTPEGYYFVVPYAYSISKHDNKIFFAKEGIDFSLIDPNNKQEKTKYSKYFYVLTGGCNLTQVMLTLFSDTELSLCDFIDPRMINISIIEFTKNEEDFGKHFEDIKNQVKKKYDIKE